MPVIFGFVGFAVDGGQLMVARRAIQNAADAAALAAAQELPAGGVCDPACQARVLAAANHYSSVVNNGPPVTHACVGSSDTKCYVNPYNGSNQLVEVRLHETVNTLFTGILHMGNVFGVSARAVSGATPVISSSTTVIDGTTDPGTVINGNSIPGTTNGGTTITNATTNYGSTTSTIVGVTTDPSTSLGGGGVGFAMSRVCGDSSTPGAIDYSGAGAGTDTDGSAFVLGSFATNGGLTMSGNKPKKITSLYYDASGAGACPKPSTDSGTSNCTAIKWGNTTDSNNLCAKTLVDLNVNNTLPITWPVPLPTLPTLKTGPNAGTYDPSTDYPSKCVDPGTLSITGNGWAAGHGPGVYCVSGNVTLTFGGGNNGADVSGGDGYTFFALNGAQIATSGKATKARFYWPSACGARPTTRPDSYTCNAYGRTLWTNSGYDPQTLFYATYPTYNAQCAQSAICLNGQSGDLTGDIFAPNPTTFPPGPTQRGGTVSIAGGALSAGSGFIESWNLSISGNTGTYSGTGAPIVIPGGTHSTTVVTTSTTPTTINTPTTIAGTTVDGTTTPNTTVLGTTVAGTTNTFVTTSGTTIGLDE
jgi:hypothetical protein